MQFDGLPRGARSIAFASNGTELRGWFRPSGRGKPGPLVIMTHGWSGTKEMSLDSYAEHFVARGLSVMAYDHFGFGESGGLPRQEIDPIAQTRGYRDAISFAQTLDEVNPDAIGIWGTSYAGGHVLTVAAFDKRVRCVVSQCPTISGWDNTQLRFSKDQWAEMTAVFNRDRLKRFQGEPPIMIPVIPDLSKAVVDPDRVHFGNNGAAWYINLEESSRVNWRNEITLRSLELYSEYEPGSTIERIAPTPLMMILGEKDMVTPTASCVKAFERAGGPKELVMLPGGHYDLYVENRAAAANAAAHWFEKHLVPSDL